MNITAHVYDADEGRLSLAVTVREFKPSQPQVDVHRYGTVQLFPGEDGVYTRLVLLARALEELAAELARS